MGCATEDPKLYVSPMNKKIFKFKLYNGVMRKKSNFKEIAPISHTQKNRDF